jgi:osmotically inducible lipoprotein OsmB
MNRIQANPSRGSMLIAALALITSLGACSGMSRQDQNTAIGAGVGAVGGAVLTGGGTLGTLGGAAVGGVIGSQIESDKDARK